MQAGLQTPLRIVYRVETREKIRKSHQTHVNFHERGIMALQTKLETSHSFGEIE